MLYKSLFSMAILGLSSSAVNARVYHAQQAVAEEVPTATLGKLNAMLEGAIRSVDPAFDEEIPTCECTCSDELTGTEGVIVTPTGPGLLNLCVPEPYLKVFIYFPELLQTLFPQLPAVDFVCAEPDEKKGCPEKLIIPLPLPDIPGKDDGEELP